MTTVDKSVRVRRQVLAKLGQRHEGMTRGPLSSALKADLRDYLEDVLEDLIDDGQIAATPTARGVRYTLAVPE